MKYGIVLCPKCKKPKGVILSYKTTKCIWCNKLIKLDKTQILFKTNSEHELRNALGSINAKLEGKNKPLY